MSMSQREEVRGHRCPRCGSTLITDGRRMWCTFVGSQGGPVTERPCTYGIDSPVPVPVPTTTLRAVPAGFAIDGKSGVES
jgi:hypothetical protein